MELNGKNFQVYRADNCPVDFPKEYEDRNRKFSYFTGDFGTFDIETTSHIEKRDINGKFESGYGYMYIWQFYSRTTGLVFGHTWEEFGLLLNRISDSFNSDKPQFVIYDHNLSFEFQFLN